jgi:cell division protein FtsB|tara:strand:+ start:114 stop:416 length:303 start_codon:yes stop_codon:yes gene_type:complete
MLEIIKKNYFLLIATFLVIYFFFNLLDGERGLLSYFNKKVLLDDLKKEEILLKNKIKEIEFKNSLLTNELDLDFIEILIRDKFLFGKKGETHYIVKDNEN